MDQVFDCQRLKALIPALRETARQDLVSQMIQVGFVRIVGHGIDPALIARVREITVRLYALPEETLLRCDGRSVDVQRGYGPTGTEVYEGDKLELKRMFSVGDYLGNHPLYAEYPTHWPLDDDDLEAVMELYDQLKEIAVTLVREIVFHLGLRSDDFVTDHEDSDSVFRLLENPALPEGATVATFCRNNRHVDSSLLTVMVPATVPGLVVEGADGIARHFGCVEGELVANTGRLLELMLANREVRRANLPNHPLR